MLLNFINDFASTHVKNELSKALNVALKDFPKMCWRLYISDKDFYAVSNAPMHSAVADLWFLPLPSATSLSESQKPENQGYNLMPSQDKTWMCSTNNELETYRLKECLLDLSQHHVGHRVSPESRSVIDCQWSSSRICLFNDLPLIPSLSEMWSFIQILIKLSWDCMNIAMFALVLYWSRRASFCLSRPLSICFPICRSIVCLYMT